mmetsp:Transcript_1125/g.2331  ORF Transcript_1125/g.2331 Transcript_1125/m.2331 type:complete len:338 (+) Transcript_1125:3-1016(+)
MGVVLSKACHAAFAGLLAGNMLWAAGFMKVVHCLPLSKSQREGLCILVVQAAWRLTFLFAPWVWCTALGGEAEQWRALLEIVDRSAAKARADGGPQRPVFVLGNHSSFLDAVLSACVMPARVLRRCRTYMDQHLFKTPVLATICRCIGHFPVHFKSGADGVFKVDSPKMELVEKQVDEHLGMGGWLCFFPEGQVNKNPDTLLPFRFGGMKRALDADALLVSFVCHGNSTIWPHGQLVGGHPGKVRHSVELLAPDGARALVAQLRTEGRAEEVELKDHELLARRAHERMQAQYDELKAAPSSLLSLAPPCLAVLASAGMGLGAVVWAAGALRARRATA